MACLTAIPFGDKHQFSRRIMGTYKVLLITAILLFGRNTSAKDCYGSMWFEQVLPGDVLGITAATWHQEDVLYVNHEPGSVYRFDSSAGGETCMAPNVLRLTRNSTELLYEGEANATIYFDGPGHYEAVIYGEYLINEPILSIVIGDIPIVAIQPFVILSGAWDPLTDLMRDDLRTLSEFPMIGMTFNWSTEPHEARTVSSSALSTEGTGAIVDWVNIELRDAVTTTVLNRRSGLVLRDGRVTGMDGVSPIVFPAPPGTYLISVRHRNHLGAMTVTPFHLGDEVSIVDFRDPQIELFGEQAMMPLGGVRGLWPGNTKTSTSPERVNFVGSWNDRDAILQTIGGNTPTAMVAGYYREDVNLDGTVKYTGANNDRDPILQAIGGSTPTTVIFEQLP
jgi:hypothetical protein